MGFWKIIGAGWRDAFVAMRRNDLLLFITFVAILGIVAITQRMLPDIHSLLRGSQAGPPPTFDIRTRVITIVQSVLLSLAAVPMMVTVHRYVLLNETRAALVNGKRLFYFALWLTAFRIFPSVRPPAGGSLVLHAILTAVWSVAWTYLSVRLALSFPAIALDERHPLRVSWRRTRGHWWKVAGVMLFGFLPLVILGAFIFLANSEAIEILAVSALSLVWPALGAALASELYRNLDGRDQIELDFRA